MNRNPKEQESNGLHTKESSSREAERIIPCTTTRTSESNIFFLIQRYDTYVAMANQKSSFLIAIASVVLVAAIVKRSEILTATEITSITYFNDILYLTTGLGLLGMLISCLLVILPITKSGGKYSKYTSLISYLSVATMDVETFRSELTSRDYDFWNDLVCQAHQLAKITTVKFRILNWASWFALISVVSIAILFLVTVF